MTARMQSCPQQGSGGAAWGERGEGPPWRSLFRAVAGGLGQQG